MDSIGQIFIFLATFIFVAVASGQISKLFVKLKLPLITGLLLMGIAAGPFVLDLVPKTISTNLNYINELSLAFIAFAAGSELYLRELRSRFKSIAWMTFGQLVITFILSSVVVYFIASFIPFMREMDKGARIAVAILIGTIFVARSPSSVIAVINEMRAKGSFTQTVMGVVVVQDVLVIILFAICFTSSKALINGIPFDVGFIFHLLFELMLSFVLGYFLGKFLALILSISKINHIFKTVLVLIAGYAVYLFAHALKEQSAALLSFEIIVEPLLICIIASFVLTNYTKYRPQFAKILDETGPIIYIAFFTLTGASMSLDLLAKVWGIALILFVVCLVSMIIGSTIGATLAGESSKFKRIAWMPFVTQAGVGLGLATVVANEFSEWGAEFSTVIIAVIVLNQIVGPPLFKWSLIQMGEDHRRAVTPAFDGVRDVIIFGLESQSVALAHQLKKNGWEVSIASRDAREEDIEASEIPIKKIPELSLETLNKLKAGDAEAIVLMLEDRDNLKLAELIYEHIGTKGVVVRLNERMYFEKFHRLGVLIVDPSTAIVSLMDHFVRSPMAASLLLGLEESQDTIDLEIGNPNLHGLALRDLRLPSDVIILSINRGGQMIISHGYTRLRLGDFVTLVGSRESLHNVTLRFDKPK